MKNNRSHSRYKVLDRVPGGEELNLCLLVRNSAGRLRRWRQDQCRKVGPFNQAQRTQVSIATAISVAIMALIVK